MGEILVIVGTFGYAPSPISIHRVLDAEGIREQLGAVEDGIVVVAEY